jgi:hypothetical protein
MRDFFEIINKHLNQLVMYSIKQGFMIYSEKVFSTTFAEKPTIS